MDPMTPGNKTSEGKYAILTIAASIVIPTVIALLDALKEQGLGAHWVGAASVAIGLLSAALTSMGYSKGRSVLKATAIENGIVPTSTSGGTPGVPLGQTEAPTSPGIKPATLPYAP